MVPIFHAFLDDDGHLISVNGAYYLSLLQNTVCPKQRYLTRRFSLWLMQDSAAIHCRNAVLAFFNEKVRGQVLNRRSENPWPAHRPDLNPLDFHFWVVAQNQVFMEKHNSTHQCVKSFAQGCSQQTISRVGKNVLQRATLCLEVVIFSTFCRTPVVVSLDFSLLNVQNT